MKKMKLSTKLLVSFLAVGVVPATLIGLISLKKSSSALEKQSYNQLIGMRDIKKTQIENFFEERRGDLGVLVENVAALRQNAFDKLGAVQQLKKSQIENYFSERFGDISVLSKNNFVAEALQNFTGAFQDENGTGGTQWKNSERTFGPWLTTYQEEYGYYDLFLIAENGDIVYTTCQESDLGQNVKKDIPDSSLYDCFTNSLKKASIADFRPYEPSGGIHAAFIGAPVRYNNELVGVVALQLPTDPVNAIVQKREGMGKSGETYLFGQNDGKKSFRSTMLTMGDGKYTIGYSIDCPEYIEHALAGQEVQDIFTDSSGKQVMVVAAPLKLEGLDWICVSKMDFEEAIALKVEGEEKDFFTKYTEMYGYYDLFLITPGGHVFYTVCREADYDTNMVNGKYSDSGLGKLVRNVLGTKNYALADFEPYAPSDGDPAAFIAEPVVKNGKTELIVALQLSLGAINGIMQQRAGMGQTGETYLVGSDKRMRSDSYLDPEGHSVMASFAGTINQNGCDTQASQEALSGKTDAKVIKDYNGSDVLSAYTPVKVGDTTWALLAEIDKAEAFEARNAIVTMMSIVSVISISAIITLALIITRSIVKPVNRIIAGLREGAEQVAAASSQVSSASQSLAEGATEQAAGLEETSSSLEEMSSMTKTSADNAQQANELATNARNSANQGQEAMKSMDTAINDIQKSSDETAKIIKVIDEIAFQTNLLALNAAVEAARAGEAGKGFAVVAEEVRNLAMRSAEAAKNTSEMIQESVKNSNNGVEIAGQVAKALEEIVTGINKAGELVNEIASAAGEQAQGVDQINTSVSQMDKVTQQNAANAEESASASEELNAQAEQMNTIVQELVELVGGSGSAGNSYTSRPAKTAKVGSSDKIYHQIADGQSKGPSGHQAEDNKIEPANEDIS